jgi:hypothetical protein
MAATQDTAAGEDEQSVAEGDFDWEAHRARAAAVLAADTRPVSAYWAQQHRVHVRPLWGVSVSSRC